MSTIIYFSQILGGWPHECFQSVIGETPSVALMFMERAAEAGTKVRSQAL